MPRPSLRTGTKKAKEGSVPGGRHKTFYIEEKVSSPKCSRCGRSLSFLPRSTAKIRRLSKSKKSVSRMYGGQLCSTCLRESLKRAARTL